MMIWTPAAALRVAWESSRTAAWSARRKAVVGHTGCRRVRPSSARPAPNGCSGSSHARPPCAPCLG
eukprot:scaffold1254_cov251-Pinguiococcus_pyrenoidosus.AAC.2